MKIDDKLWQQLRLLTPIVIESSLHITEHQYELDGEIYYVLFDISDKSGYPIEIGLKRAPLPLNEIVKIYNRRKIHQPLDCTNLPENEYYLILFKDKSIQSEVFTSKQTALERYRQISVSWNADLFVKIHSNVSRI